MAAFPRVAQWTTATSATSLSTIFGITESSQKMVQSILVRYQSSTATDRLYWGQSNVTNVPANAGGFLKPDDGLDWTASAGRWLNTDNFYLVSNSATTTAYISIL